MVKEELYKRWDSLGFTEGLNGCCKETVAKLFESESTCNISVKCESMPEDLPMVKTIAEKINFEIRKPFEFRKPDEEE